MTLNGDNSVSNKQEPIREEKNGNYIDFFFIIISYRLSKLFSESLFLYPYR